jgi:alpha-mannosidase
VVDTQGNVLPSQVLTKGKYDRELIFVAKDVPALGYATFELTEEQPVLAASTLRASEWQLANALYTITVDPKSGWLSSIKDTKNSRELLSGPGNELQLLEDLPTDFDAWNIGWTGVRFPTSFRGGKIVEQGPVRTILRLERDYLKPGHRKDFPTENFPTSFFTQDIILYDGLDRIDFVTDVDWWEDKTMLKVAFPLTVQDTVATYEIPYGTIRRSTQLRNSWEKAKVEVPASRWADVSTGGYGVSLLNIAKYGYDIKGNTMRLSLLRSPKSPDPTADRGKHRIEYSLYPHEGSWQTARTVQRGYEVNVPLIAIITNKHSGTLPLSQSFMRVGPDPLVLTSIKKAEDSDAWIIQWYNPGDHEVTATLELPKPPKRVVLSDFSEADGLDVPFSGQTVVVSTGHNSVRTLKCTF